MHRTIIATLVAAAAATAPAQSTVCPNTYANTRGTGSSNTLLRDAGNPRTFMIGIAGSELGAISPGDTIQGFSVRAGFTSNPAQWPPTDAVWNNYDVQLGPAVPLVNWTTALAANFAAPPLLARSGPLRIPANTFTNNAALPAPLPNAWGEFYWDLQHPYVYTGGDLAVLFTHTGSNLSGSFVYVDYQAVLGSMVGYTASSYQATTGTRVLSPSILRVHYGYGAGCAGTGGAVPNLVQNADTENGLGGSILLSVGNAAPGTVCLLAFGFGRTQLPLGAGCTVLTLPVASLLTITDSHGQARASLTVPPAVVGRIDAQAFVLDAGAALGFATSNGVEPQAR